MEKTTPKRCKLKNIFTYSFLDKEEMLEYIIDKKKILIAVNAEKILKDNIRLTRIINDNIAYPDGYGAVLALKKKGVDSIKIPGVELWLEIIKKFYKNKSFYLIGSSEEVIIKTVKRLENEYAGINILGYRNGYLGVDDKAKLINDLIEKKPDIIFIAQGSPRQEFLMDELLKKYPALYMGLGGSFDIFSGEKKRAPSFFLHFNLEWLYRLLKEPTRISRQIILLKFIILVYLKKI